MFTKIVKNIHESQIARFLVHVSSFTKQDVAKETGLSFPTVSKIIDDFVQRKMVLDLGLNHTAAGGRKPKQYSINRDFAYGLILFFDRKKFDCEVINAVGTPVESFTQTVKAEGYLATIRQIITQNMAQYPNLISVSIGVHGGVAKGKILYIDGYDELVHCDLKGVLEKEYPLEVTVENDMCTVVYGLACRKQLLEEETVICLQIADNGPGCGILVHGKPLSGFVGLVGEVGYLPAWDGKTMQDIALAQFENTNAVDYFARLIASVCVFFNPRQITLYENPYVQDPARLQEACRAYIPDLAIPQIELSPDYETDFMSGLRKLALNSFYPSYQVIQE